MPSTKFATGKQRFHIIYRNIRIIYINYYTANLKFYFVYHDVLWGINARNTRRLEAIRYTYVLRGISFSVLDTKTKIFTFTRDIMPPIIFILFYKVVLSKLKITSCSTLLKYFNTRKHFYLGFNDRGVGQITSNVVTFQWMWQWWSF